MGAIQIRATAVCENEYGGGITSCEMVVLTCRNTSIRLHTCQPICVVTYTNDPSYQGHNIADCEEENLWLDLDFTDITQDCCHVRPSVDLIASDAYKKLEAPEKAGRLWPCVAGCYGRTASHRPI